MHPSTSTRLGLTILLAISLLAASFGGATPQAHASNSSPDIAPDGLSAQDWTASRTQIQAPMAVCTATSVFTSAADVSVGTSPRPVVTGDFNNDGNLDFATTNSGGDNVSIRLGNGDGTFTSAADVIVGTGPNDIATGDFNNDSNLDFATANYNASSLSIRLGNGDGTFTNAADVAAPNPMKIAVGDFNNDGNRDLVATDYSGFGYIRLGNGDGTFTNAADVSGFGLSSGGVAVGDFNNDGNQDFAAVSATVSSAYIRLGNGDGTFTSAADVAVGSDPSSIAVGDFNNDGNQDLAVTAPGSASYSVSIRLGNGNGTFSGTTEIPSGGYQVNGVALGDFNDDGNQDVAFAINSQGVVAIHLGDGVGGFSILSNVTVGSVPLSVAVGDFNNDSNLDFAAANYIGNDVSIRLGDCVVAVTYAANGGTGSLPTQANVPLNGSFTVAANTLTLTGYTFTGWNDGTNTYQPGSTYNAGTSNVTLTAQWAQNNTVTAVSPASNSHTAALIDNISFTANTALLPASVTPSTFTIHGGGHGRMNGVITASGGDTIFTYNPAANFFPGEIIRATASSSIQDSTFTPIVPYVWQFRTATQAGTALLQPHPIRPDFGSGASRGLAVGDVNNDGFPDVIMAKDSGAPEEVWLNDGTGDFGAAASSTFGAGDSMSVALGDVDGDSDLDAAVSQWGALNEIWLNDGTGNFGASAYTTFGSGSNFRTALGDVDGDGDLDAVVARGWGETEQTWLNDGTGNFSAHPTRPDFGLGDSLDVVLADLDGDGDLDAAVANDSGEAETVWLNDGSGDFGAAPFATFGAGDSRGLDWGDVDGDGDADLVVANYTSQPDEVWLNDGTGNFGVTAAYTFGTTSDFDTNLGDVDGDGDLDVVTGSLGAEEIWLNQGGTQGGTPGDFGTAAHHTFGTDTSWETILADVNADGILDAVVANWNQGAGVWLNAPAAAATQIISVTPASNSHTALPTDNVSFTSAAPLDVPSVGIFSYIVHGGGHGHMVGTITPSLGDTVFTYDPTFAFFPGEIVQASASSGILDGDLLPIQPFVWQFRVAAGAGSGLFTDSGLSLPSPASWGVALGDLDGDGDLDAYVANHFGQPNQVFFSDGLGSFYDSGQSLGGSDTLDVSLGDLDGDGDLDAFEANYSGQPNLVWLNDGNGLFTNSGQSLGTAASTDIGLGDLDGDGDLDAFVANGNNEPDQVYLNDGSGTFTDSGQSLGNSNTEGVTLGDLDNDGDLDAFTVNLSQPAEVWLNNGDGTFAASGQVFPSYQSNDVSLGDLDNDGDLDAFVANFNQANTVWLNDGFGVFIDSGQSLGTLAHTAVSLGDVDADGDLDAFVTAANNLPETLWLNDGTGVFYSSGLALGTATSEDVSLGDVDGNGSLDAFVVSGSANSLWLNPANPITVLDDFASVLQDSVANPIDVLANDLPTGILYVDQVGPAANGSIVNNFTDVIYTPNPGFYGTDVFTYTATDEVYFSTASVYVTVLPTIPQADLLIRNLRASPSDVCRGQNFSLTLRPTNQGNLDAGTHSILLYNEASPDTRNKLLGQIPLAGLLAGQGKNYGLSTSSFITGTRYLIAVADGNHQIVEFDELNNASFITITVQDDPAPVGTISIGDGTGAAYVTNSIVTATLQATDSGNCVTGVGQMRFSINGIVSGWEPYTTTKALTLPTNGNGPLTIYAQFKDLHNNVSGFVGTTITYDNQPPRSGIVAPAGLTSTTPFTVTWQGFDEGSGLSNFDVQVNLDGGGWTDWLTQIAATEQAYTAQVGQTVCLRVRARDLAGNVEAYPQVASACVDVVSPVASDDLRPQNILLTQGIQTAANSVPLIAGRPLLVQVPVEAGTNFANVDAQLHVLQGGQELPGSPLSPANGRLALSPSPAADTNQFQFLLPSEWLSGTLEIYVEVDPENAISEGDERNNRFPAQGRYPMIFDGPRTLEVTLVPVVWQRGAETLEMPPALLLQYADILQRMYPVSQVNLRIHPSYAYSADNINWPTLLAEIESLRSAEQPNPTAGQKYVALLPYPGGGTPTISETVGLAYQPGNTAAVYAYPNGGQTLALHLAHTFGLSRQTVDICPPTSGGTIYYSGWDFIHNAILAATTPELMTGCPGAWVSPATYQTLSPYMSVGTSAYQRPEIPRGSLLLTGWLDPTAASGGLNTAFQFTANLAALPTSSGNFHIQLIDSNGHAEIIRDISPAAFSDPKLPAGQQPFAITLPSLTDLSAARLYYQDTLLSELLPGSAPVITITSSIPLTLTTSTHTLTWQAENASAYLVRYSWNGGINWMQVSPILVGTRFVVDLSKLPGTDHGIFEVLASGGLRSAAARQSGFTMANKPPQAAIFSPAPEGDVYTDTVTLQGAAFDLEDGILADEQLVWISDKDGILGVGNTLVVELSPGGHLITLQVTDSRGLRTSVSVDFHQQRLFLPLVNR